MKYSYINSIDIDAGPKFRVALYIQGSEVSFDDTNVRLRDFNNGKEFDMGVENEIINLSYNKDIDGLTITGGEPFDWVPHQLNYDKYYVKKFYDLYKDYTNLKRDDIRKFYDSLPSNDVFELNPVYHLIKRYKTTYPNKSVWVFSKYDITKLVMDTSSDKEISIGSDLCIEYIDVLANRKLHKYIDIKRTIENNSIITYSEI